MRRAWLLAMVFAALPLWAHGESLLQCFSFFGYVIPGAVLLFTPWNRSFGTRLFVVVLQALGAVFIVMVILPRIAAVPMSAFTSWLIFLSPSILAALLAIVIWRVEARDRRNAT